MSSPGAKTREAVPRKVRSRSTVLTSPGSPRRIRTSPGVLLDEVARPRGGFQLTAGENLSSPAVLAGLGSVLNDKHAEGYPGHRYYRGCEEAGRAEEIAVERAKRLFGSINANVQPYSGTTAILAAYAALPQPGDTVPALALEHGGRITHGSKAGFSGRRFDVVSYGVRRDTETIDYDEVRDLALRHRPPGDRLRRHGVFPADRLRSARRCAPSSAPTPRVPRLCRRGGGQRQDPGGGAGGRGAAPGVGRHRHPPRAGRPARRRVSGAEAERRCAEAGILLDHNAIPYDPASATAASGIRAGTLGTPIQGMGRGGTERDRVSHRPGHPAPRCDNVGPRTGKGADRDASGISPSGIGRSMSFARHN